MTYTRLSTIHSNTPPNSKNRIATSKTSMNYELQTRRPRYLDDRRS